VSSSGPERRAGGRGPQGSPPPLTADWERAWQAELDALDAGSASHELGSQWCARERTGLAVERRAVRRLLAALYGVRS
jgi:hypothetical protein